LSFGDDSSGFGKCPLPLVHSKILADFTIFVIGWIEPVSCYSVIGPKFSSLNDILRVTLPNPGKQNSSCLDPPGR